MALKFGLNNWERFHAARNDGVDTRRARLTVAWLVVTATASERRKNKRKLSRPLKRPVEMTLDARPLKYKDDAVGSYAKTWAAARIRFRTLRRAECCTYDVEDLDLRDSSFAAIDVGCTYGVEGSSD